MTIQCFALILLHTGKKVNKWTFKIFIKKKRVNSQNLFSNTNSAALKVWYDACCSEHRSRHFRPLPSSGVTCCSADGLRKSSLTFWSAVEGWCDKPIWDRGYIQSVPRQIIWSLFFPLTHYILLRKITCEEEWTPINLSRQTIDLVLGENWSVVEQSAVCRPIGKSLMNHIMYMLL